MLWAGLGLLSGVSFLLGIAGPFTGVNAFGTCPSVFVATPDLEFDRAVCVKACNDAGYCCTEGRGMCQRLSCSAGCHMAWYSSTKDECVAECRQKNNQCIVHHPDQTVFQNCQTISKCGCNPNSTGLGPDCNEVACETGCELAENARGASFYGRVLSAAELAEREQASTVRLDQTLLDLESHILNTAMLSAVELNALKATLVEESSILKQGGETLEKAFDVIETYEDSALGPLSFPFNRVGVDGDGFDLSRTMLVLMQGIMDEVYNSGDMGKTSLLFDCSRAVFEERQWKIGAVYPGAVSPPADPTVVHSVTLRASVAKAWGAPVAFSMLDADARRPLGLHLSPGAIAEIVVPEVMVEKGFKVLIGGQTADNSIKDNHLRMDRVTVTVPINSVKTLVSSPLGGSLYIMVPYLANLGTQSVNISGGVAKSPLFQRTSLRTMTNDDWKAIRTAPGTWADFETELFMMTVPSSWIYAFDDPISLLNEYNSCMEGVSEMFGYPVEKRTANKQILYLMPDLHIKADAYGVGYPQTNRLMQSDALVSPRPNRFDGYSENAANGILRSATIWATEFHELGHQQQQQEPRFEYIGETEAIVNFVWTYVRHMKYGDHFNQAFSTSLSFDSYTPDQAAVHWMITPNFRQGKEMDNSATEEDEFRYQHRGYAKYADLVRLFGWEFFSGYYHQRNIDFNNNVSLTEWQDGLPRYDARTFRLSIQAGCDVTPLIFFWGIHPDNPTALSEKMKSKGLQPCPEIQCLLLRYRTIVPQNNQEFNDFFDEIYPGRPAAPNLSPRFGLGWYNVWRDTYADDEGGAAVAQIDKVLASYYAEAPAPTCPDHAVAAKADVPRPCQYAWQSERSQTTVNCTSSEGDDNEPVVTSAAADNEPVVTSAAVDNEPVATSAVVGNGLVVTSAAADNEPGATIAPLDDDGAGDDNDREGDAKLLDIWVYIGPIGGLFVLIVCGSVIAYVFRRRRRGRVQEPDRQGGDTELSTVEQAMYDEFRGEIGMYRDTKLGALGATK